MRYCHHITLHDWKIITYQNSSKTLLQQATNISLKILNKPLANCRRSGKCVFCGNKKSSRTETKQILTSQICKYNSFIYA